MSASRPSVRYVAHRGLPRQFPDNSRAGILAARDVASMVEIDLRRTADGAIVLSHDPEFAGLTVREHTLAELRARQAEHPIVRLEELLAELGDFPLNLEIKQNIDREKMDPDSQLAHETAALARPFDLVTSFHWPTMAVLRMQFPQLKTGLLVDQRLGIERAIPEAQALRHPVLAVHDPLLGDDPGPMVEQILAAGLELVVWTVNDPPRAQRLVSAGVHALISDDPCQIRGEGPLSPAR